MIKGQVISGEYGKVLIRQKSNEDLELGELLVSGTSQGKILMQVYSLLYGSQISQQNLELISGMNLEDEEEPEFMEANLRNYMLAQLKPLVTYDNKNATLCKKLPKFFATVREITKEDMNFISKPEDKLFVGKLRSGSKVLDLDINLKAKDVLSHHILISGTTGKGKSVLLKNMIWSTIGKNYCGMLILDPHDEYYGRNDFGMKDNEHSDKVSYYTTRAPPPGARTLKINLRSIKPSHFNGVFDFSDPQKQALNIYYKEFKEKWIEAIILEKRLQSANFRDDTLAVIKRQLLYILNLDFLENQLECKGVFDIQSGETTIKDICKELEEAQTVIIDTSHFSGQTEILIGSLISSELLSHYQFYKTKGTLNEKPVISIILEEAPRVLGKEILEKGANIFSTIAREGRKFKIGLCAITQLPSLIPRQVLANMNTKIILGTEMKPERQAIIESSSQDLSDDDRTIASLDKGEILITSNFTSFAIPVKVPLFSSKILKTTEKKETYKKDFSDIM